MTEGLAEYADAFVDAHAFSIDLNVKRVTKSTQDKDIVSVYGKLGSVLQEVQEMESLAL